jgi:DNA (cytosine-5)-methyltransferase 1
MTNFTVASLFSGAGGLDLGFVQTGRFDVLFANDILNHMTKTYSKNFGIKLITNASGQLELPAVLRADVAKIKFDDLRGANFDVLVAGPPCQDFSIVRGPEKITKGPRTGELERAGISVSRGKLYSHFVRALVRLQPKVFVFENVPGLVSSNKGKAYEVILEDFSNLNLRWGEIKELLNNDFNAAPRGYKIVYNGLVDASKLGVPQARKRLIIIGLRRDLEKDLALKEDLRWKIADALTGRSSLVSKYPLTPLEVFEGRALPDLEDKYRELMDEYEGVDQEVGTLRAQKWKESASVLTFDVVKDYINLNRIEPKNEGEVADAFAEHSKILEELGYYGVRISDLECPDGSNKIPREPATVLERMRRIPPGENHEFVRGTKWGVEGRGISLIYRRLHPLKPAYTVVAYGGGGTWGYHYERGRSKLTNRERARLQTFPDSFEFKGNNSQVRAQIGEAVPPLMGKVVGGVVAKILEVAS